MPPKKLTKSNTLNTEKNVKKIISEQKKMLKQLHTQQIKTLKNFHKRETDKLKVIHKNDKYALNERLLQQVLQQKITVKEKKELISILKKKQDKNIALLKKIQKEQLTTRKDKQAKENKIFQIYQKEHDYTKNNASKVSLDFMQLANNNNYEFSINNYKKQFNFKLPNTNNLESRTKTTKSIIKSETNSSSKPSKPRKSPIKASVKSSIKELVNTNASATHTVSAAEVVQTKANTLPINNDKIVNATTKRSADILVNATTKHTASTKANASASVSASKSKSKSKTPQPEVEPIVGEELKEYIKEHIDEIGIKDPEGKLLNPLTGLPYSSTYTEISLNPEKGWITFPLYPEADKMIKLIRENQVLLFIAGTGVGKTVLVPKYALHSTNYAGKVVVTIPKTNPVRTGGEFAAAALDVELGTYAGYQYRGAADGRTDGKKPKSNKTQLLFSTDGSIVATMLGDDPYLTAYDIIIIDEAHERTVNIDLLLMLLKTALKNNPNLKLIIMSATINKQIFKDYYEKDFTFADMEVGGVIHDIEDHYVDKPIKKESVISEGIKLYLDKIASKAQDDIKKQLDEGKTREELSLVYDTLFFVSSIAEAKTACNELQEHINKRKFQHMPLCIEFSGEVKDGDIIKKVETNNYKVMSEWKHVFKIIFATNVIESSSTIKSLKFVIDNGYAFISSYDPKANIRLLESQRITKDSAKQRRGRVGRVSPGTCYKLYTKKEHDEMGENKIYDIQQNDITGHLLHLLSIPQINNVNKLREILSKLIQPPKYEYIESGLKVLRQYKCISSDNNISLLGKLMAKYMKKTDFYLSKSLLLSILLNCSNEMSTLIACIMKAKGQMKNIFKTPARYLTTMEKEKIDAERRKLKIIKSSSDHLTIYNIYAAFKAYKENHSVEDTKKWCIAINVNFNTLNKVTALQKQIYRESRDLIVNRYKLKDLVEQDNKNAIEAILENNSDSSDKEDNKNKKDAIDKINGGEKDDSGSDDDDDDDDVVEVRAGNITEQKKKDYQQSDMSHINQNKQYLRDLLQLNSSVNIEQLRESSDIENKLLHCLAFSYSTQAAKLTDKRRMKYQTVFPMVKTEAEIDQDSIYKQHSNKLPLRYIIYTELTRAAGRLKYNLVSGISEINMKKYL